ncbi:hypothetical protein NO135_24920, partial [Clostridioides difficile]|nr:hypothetical protein [Clostridioides difficile]
RSLGDRETGGGLALPVWSDYMGAALKGVPEFKPPVPDGGESVGGELYFTEFAPGHGFVSTVGVPQAPAAQNVDA